MNGKAALRLLQDISILHLGGYDGCLCTNCEIQGVCIDVSCRKSSGSAAVRKLYPGFHGTLIRVYSRHLDEDGGELEAIAREVARQIGEGGEIRARFTDYRHDDQQLCTYCDKKREEPTGYLCANCFGKKSSQSVGRTMAEDRDFRRYDFTIPADDE